MVVGVLLTFYKLLQEVFIIPYEATYHSVHLLPFNCSYADVQFHKMHTQKCGNFEKTMRMTFSHVQYSYFRTCLNNVNVSKWHFECDPH